MRRVNAREFLLDLLPAAEHEALPEAAIIAAARDDDLGKSVVQEELRKLCVADDPSAPFQRARGAGEAPGRAYGYWRCSDAA